CATQSYGVIPKKLYSYKTVEVISGDLNSFKLVKKDNFVISLRSFEGGIEHSNYQGIISPAYTILEPQVEIYSFYFKFLFKSSFFISTLNIHKIGIREGQNISYASLQYTPIPLPPLQKQKEIAEFLDSKCEKIQNYIDKKQKLITLLQEKKQALINEAVTKGLNPNIESKNSGIEYLGLIPHHWEVKKLKILFSLGNGLNITKQDFVSYGIPCVSYGEIHSKYPCRLDTSIHKLPYVSETYLADKPQSLLTKGDFVFADTSEDIEGSGNFTSIQSYVPVFAGYHTIILKPKTSEINDLYFSFLFDSFGIRSQIRKEVCGVKVFSITKSILKEIQCLLPPLQEQKEIAEFLDKKCEKINSVIEKTKKQIELIKEYKNTLINEAVCGRINLERK
ncbi:restriction endonuclease subunit S, partial [Campylobacter upsaliensis]|nr:restriction endonuclease subunit S [Campylobacter upsaliensis]